MEDPVLSSVREFVVTNFLFGDRSRLPQDTDAAARAGIALAYVLGRWLRYAKSGFRRAPGELFEQQAMFLIA